mgnify:FL=1
MISELKGKDYQILKCCVGSTLKKLREENTDLTQHHVHTMNQANLSKIELGKRMISLQSLFEITVEYEANVVEVVAKIEDLFNKMKYEYKNINIDDESLRLSINKRLNNEVKENEKD